MYSCRQAEVPLVWLVQLMCTARAVFPSLRVLLALVVVYPLLPGGRWRALVAMRSWLAVLCTLLLLMLPCLALWRSLPDLVALSPRLARPAWAQVVAWSSALVQAAPVVVLPRVSLPVRVRLARAGTLLLLLVRAWMLGAQPLPLALVARSASARVAWRSRLGRAVCP
jgi:hypothetical protein